jgi:hypothetical protein
MHEIYFRYILFVFRDLLILNPNFLLNKYMWSESWKDGVNKHVMKN